MCLSIASLETVEQLRLNLVGYARAVILDDDPAILFSVLDDGILPDVDLNGLSAPGVLDGVPDKVSEDVPYKTVRQYVTACLLLIADDDRCRRTCEEILPVCRIVRLRCRCSPSAGCHP